MAALFIWVILALVVAAIGSSRNRGVDGFFVSLILSPLIGLIWVLAMPNLRGKQ